MTDYDKLFIKCLQHTQLPFFATYTYSYLVFKFTATISLTLRHCSRLWHWILRKDTCFFLKCKNILIILEIEFNRRIFIERIKNEWQLLYLNKQKQKRISCKKNTHYNQTAINKRRITNIQSKNENWKKKKHTQNQQQSKLIWHQTSCEGYNKFNRYWGSEICESSKSQNEFWWMQ